MARELVRSNLPAGLIARVVTSDISDGNFAPWSDYERLGVRRAQLAPEPWTWLRQVHGSAAVVVRHPGEGSGEIADAAVTNCLGCTLSVTVADCAPVVILADGGGLAIIHAGWRGVLAGVIESAMGALVGLAPGPYRAVIGPCIRPCCYRFGVKDLEVLVQRLGDGVLGETRSGSPALDLTAAVCMGLAQAGVVDQRVDGVCTACDGGYWSYRRTGARERQATVGWLELP